TSTERRILFSPEIPGRRIGESLPEWEIPMRIAERVRPELAHLIHFEDAQSIRDDISRAVPLYEGIQHLKKAGDQIQWGGERLCEGQNEDGSLVIQFPTLDGRARFSMIQISETISTAKLRLSTRRGKSFNSMGGKDRAPITGARRDEVLMNSEDAERLGLSDGDQLLL